MKKILITILTTLCFAACIEENIDTDQQLQEITFDTDFTAYVTKSGEVTQEEFPYDFFYVWGYQTNSKGETTQIFNEQPVALRNGTWTYKVKVSYGYDNGQWRYVVEDDQDREPIYWMPNCTYKFWAIAPYETQMINITNPELPTIEIAEFLSPRDFMYAYLQTKTKSGNGSAVLKFNHIISNVSLTFENSVDPNITLQVSDIKFRAHGGGVMINEQTFMPKNPMGNITYTPDDISNTIRYNDKANTDPVIVWPSSDAYEYTISFDISLNIPTPTTKAGGATKINGSVTQSLNAGTAYKFVIDITPEVINKGETDILVQEIPGWNPKPIDKQQLSIASKLGGTVTLTDDLTLSDSFNVLDDLTINLNGKTLTYTGNTQLFNVTGTGSLIINGNDNDASSIISSGLIATAVDASSTITINGGIHTTTGTTTYNTSEGKLYIKDGKFSRTTEYDLSERTIIDGIESNIFINGGSFCNWDPSQGEAFNGTNDGTISYNNTKIHFLNKLDYTNEIFEITIDRINDKNWYTVQRETRVSDITDIKTALENTFVDKIVIDNECEINNNGNQLIVNHNVVIEGKGPSSSSIITGGATGNNYIYGLRIEGPYEVTIQNLTIKGGGVYAIPTLVDGHPTGNGPTIIMNNCNITTTYGKNGGNAFYLYGGSAEVTDVNITISGNASTKYYAADGGSTIKVYTTDKTKGICQGTSTVGLYGEGMHLYGGTYDKDPTLWVADGYEAVKNGQTWTVQPQQ